MAPSLPPGLARSLSIYRGDPARDAALQRFYAPFVPQGGLAFDIGAHVGDRSAAFRRLGARVVALEPQADCAAHLATEFAQDDGFVLHQAAIGAAPGRASLLRNSANPTVSTLSADFVAAAQDATGWEGQVWEPGADVEIVTLDALIARHGRPDFIKLDVEGYELEALRGLSQAPPALSFEFTTIQRDLARACLDRLVALGFTRFRASLGESLAFAQPRWIGAADMAAWLAGLPESANSGDVYARL